MRAKSGSARSSTLGSRGWRAIHDVDTGRGNIDHVLVGPGGVVTVETKSHRGTLAVDRLDERMLKQAYAQAKHVERITGHAVAPLLVFSRAYLDRPVSRRRGVTVLPARMLPGHLERRPARLSSPEVEELHRALAAVLGSGVQACAEAARPAFKARARPHR